MIYQRIHQIHLERRVRGWSGGRSVSLHPPRRASSAAAASGRYDHPALYANEDAFAERTYWDGRFRDEALGKEWYRGYASLAPVIRAHLDPASGARILHAGVGTSTLQVDMALAGGYARVHSVDYSRVAIERLKAARLAYTGPQAARLRSALSYAVADMCDLQEYADAEFGGAIEKGALDALACGDTADADLAAAVGALWRVLAPGAPLISVTWAKPGARLPVLLRGAPRPWASAAVYEVGQGGAMAGPFPVDVGSVGGNGSVATGGNGGEGGSSGIALDDDALARLPSLAYSHFVYVCVK